MKTKLKPKYLIIAAIALLLVAFLVGIMIFIFRKNDGSTDSQADSNITISFDTRGGDEISSKTVAKGTSFTIKELPIAYKAGYNFGEWYLDPEMKNSFVSSDGVFNSDTTLYASYTEQIYKKINWVDTSETSLMDQPSDTELLIAANGAALTSDNLFDYLSVENHFDAIELPELTVEKSGDNYVLKPVGTWNKSGMYTFELASPFKFLVDMTDREREYTYAASKLYFSVEAEEEHGVFEEQSFVIEVGADDYYSASEKSVYLKSDFAFESGVQKGSILKIYDKKGDFEYYKADNLSTSQIGFESAVGVTLVSPELNEVFSEFDVSSRDKLTIEDSEGDLDAEEVRRQFESNESFEILQNYSMMSAVDYINSKNITVLSGATLKDGRVIPTGYSTVAPVAEIDWASTSFDIYSEYLDDVGPKYEDNIKFTCVSGSWRINMGDDTYAIATVTVKDGGWIYFGAEGRAKTTSSFPYVDIGFSVSAGVEAYEIFEFDIIIYHEGEVYDVREDIAEKGHYAPDIMVSRYRTLLGLEDSDINFKVTLFEFNTSVWGILNFGFPVSVEFNFTLNGSFAVTIENNWFHIFGFKGGTDLDFAAHHAELYQEQMIATYYNGMFGVSAGITMGVRFSILNLSSLGQVGIDFGVGVYFDFYGYGHTYSEYSKVLGYYQPVDYWDFFSKKDKYESSYQEREYYEESGGSYRELGIYLKLELVAESDVFGASADVDIFNIKIPLMTAGDDYVVLGFSNKTTELMENGLTVDKYGFDLTEYDINKMKVMYLKTGKVEEIEMDPEYFELRGVMNVGSFSENKLSVRDDVINRARSVVSQMQLTYKGGNVYNSTGPIYLYPEVRYVPFEIDDSKVNDVYTVNLTLEGRVFETFEVPYGASVLYVLEKAGRSADELVPADLWMSEHPDYEYVSWKYSDLTKLITENTSFEEYKILRSIKVGYSTGYINKGYNDFRMYNVSYIWTPVGVSLYDVLADTDTSDPCASITYKGWDTPDKTLTAADDGITVNAEYEFKDITVTVEVKPDTVSGRDHGKPGTYTYTLTPGTSARSVIGNHIGIYGEGYMAYVDPERSTNDMYENLYTDAYFLVDWEREYAYVTFYDPFGVAIERYLTNMFSDASYLLEKDEIFGYGYEHIADDGSLIEFVGWGGTEKLTRITGDVSIMAIIAKGQRNVAFDPNGGSFKYTFANIQDGNYAESFYYGETVSDEILNFIEPTKADTEYIDYEFAGWYYLDENNEKQFGVKTVTEDITYYAEWKQTERLWPVTISGKDILGTLQGTFADGSTEKTLNLPYSEATALAEAVIAGDYSDITEVPTVKDTEYSVYKWYIIENVGESYVLKPFFTLPNGQLEADTVIIWDIGRGMNFNGETGTYKTVETDGALTFLQWHEPRKTEEDHHLGIFADSGYYYEFSGWSVLQNGVVSQKNTGDEISVALTGETVYVTAIYEKVPMEYLYTFEVEAFIYDNETGYPEYWERLHFDGHYYSDQYQIGVTQDRELTSADLPAATKMLSEDIIWNEDNNRLWEYRFDYWECVETGEKFVDLTPDGNRTYVAHFKKVARTVTVTLYAGDNAYFPSTGEQYMVFENVTAGTEFYVITGMAEAPVHNDSVYVFDGWDTFELMDLTYDTKATAYYWNTEIGCAEGEEDMIRIQLDAGPDAQFEHGGRYCTVAFEEGQEIKNSYLSAFLIVKNGVTYEAVWDILDTVATKELSGTVVHYTSLSEYDPGPAVILFTLDAGENGVFEKSGERYMDVREFEGQTLTKEYMDGYTVIINGTEYIATWEGFEGDTLITLDLRGKTVTYISLTPKN